MDYADRQRIKIWGRARVVERGAAADEPIWAALPDDAERAIAVTVEAWDVNCAQHITPRFDEETVAMATAELTKRNAEQAHEIGRLRARLAAAGLDPDARE